MATLPSGDDVILLVHARIDASALIDHVRTAADGAIVTFDGCVRNQSHGRRTLYLDYEAYESLFKCDAHAIVKMEATPVYMYWLPAVSRLAEYNPETKLILILRDPIERAISQWEMEFSRGTESEVFEIAIEREREYLSRGQQHRVRSYIDRGFYGVQIRRILSYFPREHMLLLKRDDLLTEHQKEVQERQRNETPLFLEVFRRSTPDRSNQVKDLNFAASLQLPDLHRPEPTTDVPLTPTLAMGLPVLISRKRSFPPGVNRRGT